MPSRDDTRKYSHLPALTLGYRYTSPSGAKSDGLCGAVAGSAILEEDAGASPELSGEEFFSHWGCPQVQGGNLGAGATSICHP